MSAGKLMCAELSSTHLAKDGGSHLSIVPFCCRHRDGVGRALPSAAGLYKSEVSILTGHGVYMISAIKTTTWLILGSQIVLGVVSIGRLHHGRNGRKTYIAP